MFASVRSESIPTDPLMRKNLALLCALVGLAVSCAQGPEQRRDVDDPAVPPPILLNSTAYEAAAVIPLPDTKAAELPGLHHVYFLGDEIISGAEPVGDEAFAEMQKLGVKTILSTDGKVPDYETAAKYGIRYVHVPIQYSGITEDERMRIAKTFREMEGPFYVHCFHGKHRGPAGAAIGRIVIDGIPRDQAIAEMRQWCGTSPKYEGLYEVVAIGHIPTAIETANYDYDFAPEHSFEGLRGGMVAMARKFDNFKLVLRKNDWKPDPAHPDIDPLQEAIQLHKLYADLVELHDTTTRPADYQQWMQQGLEGSERLQRAMSSCSQDQDEFVAGGWKQEAEEAYKLIADSCASCHAEYRD